MGYANFSSMSMNLSRKNVMLFFSLSTIVWVSTHGWWLTLSMIVIVHSVVQLAFLGDIRIELINLQKMELYTILCIWYQQNCLQQDWQFIIVSTSLYCPYLYLTGFLLRLFLLLLLVLYTNNAESTNMEAYIFLFYLGSSCFWSQISLLPWGLLIHWIQGWRVS